MTDSTKLIERLRDAADADEETANELDPMHYTPDDPEDIIAGLEFRASERRECADMLEQQANAIAEQGHKMASYLIELEERNARIAELEAFVREVSQQIESKPDYWSSCSQCERNKDRAEDLMEQGK